MSRWNPDSGPVHQDRNQTVLDKSDGEVAVHHSDDQYRQVERTVYVRMVVPARLAESGVRFGRVPLVGRPDGRQFQTVGRLSAED